MTKNEALSRIRELGGNEDAPAASPAKLTLKAAKAEAQSLGITINKTIHAEYRVNFRHGDEATAYYTDDLADALATARVMHSSGTRAGYQDDPGCVR